MGASDKDTMDGKTRVFIAILLTGPFYLNDLASIYIRDWTLWLLIDYLFVKLYPLLLLWYLVRTRRISLRDLGLRSQPLSSFVITLMILTLIGTLIDQNAYTLMAGLPGYPPLGGMPAITSPGWNYVDLTLGLFMVGVCEEIIFRGFMFRFISRYTRNRGMVILLSSLAFGLIHWGIGFHAVVITGGIGAVFMTAYMITRSVPAIILAHFIINFIDFSGWVPKSIFKFF